MNVARAESYTTHVMLSTRLATELGEPHSTLRAVTRRHDSAVVISAGGEIDAANEHTWRRLVREAAAIATAPGPFVVDINDVAFMGCCAFAVLAEEAQRCRRQGVELRVVSLDPGVQRVVDACGLSGVLPLHPTVESALTAA
ncbi:anti-anti-sigma factor [Mycobacterium intermedium]|uniref:Anti-sigma factor antagonist n=1 Tax=Mycobacterium intermedium TaxID=28445 RepID=A0A1E3SN44_MYCIE|nr:anti-sigma factor antagonist [Mycobacterium intermedium]MCV6964779.1 anti-sigma factor antagonist [Mycobacterium intermedium]ODR03053.1 anti-anti-sigma factor [Mycobacterium intermedium]OPE48344.1 anti-anti-sigma factor [Mycobacterium intermedium]ORB02398.1 anti-anti-sigma factor [Mycobacterium intermedium]